MIFSLAFVGFTIVCATFIGLFIWALMKDDCSKCSGTESPENIVLEQFSRGASDPNRDIGFVLTKDMPQSPSEIPSLNLPIGKYLVYVRLQGFAQTLGGEVSLQVNTHSNSEVAEGDSVVSFMRSALTIDDEFVLLMKTHTAEDGATLGISANQEFTVEHVSVRIIDSPLYPQSSVSPEPTYPK
jgi:hypothetical protein